MLTRIMRKATAKVQKIPQITRNYSPPKARINYFLLKH